MSKFITITAVDGEVLGIPISSIQLVTEFIGDAQYTAEDGPYSRVRWKDPCAGKMTWTTVHGSVNSVIKSINNQLS